MIIWPPMEQGSEQWFEARRGRPTASNFDRIATPTGNASSQAEDYMIELIADCIRPDMVDFIGNRHTDRGNELEPAARDEFAEIMQLDVRQVGFITRDDEIVGCSPDALIYDRDEIVAGLEIKCPLAKNHARYVLDGELPAKYAPQVHGSMAVTGLNRWFFMSYCEGMRPFIVQVDRDAYTEKLSAALDRFVIDYWDMREKLIPQLVDKTVEDPEVDEHDSSFQMMEGGVL
jgi:predicted phage-related endonuclease